MKSKESFGFCCPPPLLPVSVVRQCILKSTSAYTIGVVGGGRSIYFQWMCKNCARYIASFCSYTGAQSRVLLSTHNTIQPPGLDVEEFIRESMLFNNCCSRIREFNKTEREIKPIKFFCYNVADFIIIVHRHASYDEVWMLFEHQAGIADL